LRQTLPASLLLCNPFPQTRHYALLFQFNFGHENCIALINDNTTQVMITLNVMVGIEDGPDYDIDENVHLGIRILF